MPVPVDDKLILQVQLSDGAVLMTRLHQAAHDLAVIEAYIASPSQFDLTFAGNRVIRYCKDEKTWNTVCKLDPLDPPQPR